MNDKTTELINKLRARVYHQWGHLTFKQRGFPSLLLIGPRRTGTTTMFKTLDMHPNMIGASRKEIKFFNINYWRGMSWYQGFFPRRTTLEENQAITFEASPYYIYHPLAAERIRKHFPEMKIIATLRNPIDRAYSDYKHNVGKRKEPLQTFEEAIAAEQARLAGQAEKIAADPHYSVYNHMKFSYQDQGIYHKHLERLFSIFPREQILVVNSERFFTNMHAEFDRIIEFLGLPVWQLTASRNANPQDYSPIKPETRQRLVEFFELHNQQLYEMLDDDFGWK